MKISYHKRWGKDGTVYSQAIRIAKDEFCILRDAIHAEIASNYPRRKEYTFDYIYLKPIFFSDTGKRKICYLNLTQTGFINLFFRLKLKDRNTLLLID